MRKLFEGFRSVTTKCAWKAQCGRSLLGNADCQFLPPLADVESTGARRRLDVSDETQRPQCRQDRVKHAELRRDASQKCDLRAVGRRTLENGLSQPLLDIYALPLCSYSTDVSRRVTGSIVL